MPTRLQIDLELSDELAAELRGEDIRAKATEALVMELLREHRISQGKAVKLLGIDRHTLFELMTKYRVPVIDFTPEELEAELQKPFPRS